MTDRPTIPITTADVDAAGLVVLKSFDQAAAIMAGRFANPLTDAACDQAALVSELKALALEIETAILLALEDRSR